MRRWFIDCFHVLAFAVRPIAMVVGSNAGVIPLGINSVARPLMAVAGSVLLLIFALGALKWDLRARTMWLGVLLLLCGFFRPAIWALGLDPTSPAVASLYVLWSATIALVAIRPWQIRRRDPWPLNIVAAVLLVAALWPVIGRSAAEADTWRAAADDLVATTGAPAESVPGPAAAERDIYYIVLDGLGRADVLREYYAVDLAPLVESLKARGFVVPEESRSNYAQTFLTLASALNMSYLDPLVRAVGETSHDRRPLKHLIDGNALMSAASAVGYEVVAVGSDTSATEWIDGADICVCAQPGLFGVEQAAIALTPMVALPLDRWTYDAHRQKITTSFAAIEQAGSTLNRRLVFAHILVPHPPFVFAADGAARRPPGPLAFGDGDHYDGSPGDYVEGYREQVKFVARRLQALVETLVARPGPPPAIVIHGDHGPASMLAWEDPDATNMRERMAIFSAYYFPGGELAGTAPALSPINTARLLARKYMGLDLPPLRDESFFSTWGRPYTFIRVDLDD